MTATFTEKRRTSPTPPRPLRELPVLFHLMDVSRPKGFSAPPPAFSLDAEDEPSALGSAESFDLETAAKLVETKALRHWPPRRRILRRRFRSRQQKTLQAANRVRIPTQPAPPKHRQRQKPAPSRSSKHRRLATRV
jgi:hypothetical protein